MGLDACIYCDCFENELLKAPPNPLWRVTVAEDGAREPATQLLEEQIAFDRWNRDKACSHRNGVLLHHRLGNSSLINYYFRKLSEYPGQFPLLLRKVVYDGIHCGDYLTPSDVKELLSEIEALTTIHDTESLYEEHLRNFEIQLLELTTCAMRVHKPIVF